MFIQKLEIYSALLNETTQKLMQAIKNVDVNLIKELSTEIENLSAKVAKYSEKAQKEVTRTINKIENGQLTNYKMFSNNRDAETVNKISTISKEIKELIVDMVINKTDNTPTINTLNEEYMELGSANGIKGYSYSLESDIKVKNNWVGSKGHEPITMIDFSKLTYKKTVKGEYLYKNENERYTL